MWKQGYRLPGGLAVARTPRDPLMRRATAEMRRWRKTLTPKDRARTMLGR
jgi:hypothetical protein